MWTERYQKKPGYFGAEFLCTDTQLDREVELRQFPSNQRLEIGDQLRRLQTLRTPYLSMAYDLVDGERRDTFAIVEERLSLLEEQQDPIVQAYQLCTGLEILHRNDLCHGKLDAQALGNRNPIEACLRRITFERANSQTKTRDVAQLKMLIRERLPTRTGTVSLRKDVERATSAIEMRQVLERSLLWDAHRAVLQRRGERLELDRGNRRATIEHARYVEHSCVIHYDGNRFSFEEVSGSVYMNNKEVEAGDALVGSCVLKLGANAGHPAQQESWTFDSSHPEVR